MKHLLITLKIQDGEREHTHRCLHTTTGNNVQFAAQHYASNYWGEGERDKILSKDRWWFFGGEIAVLVESVTELTENEFKLMDEIFCGDTERSFNVTKK
jgi:hypothetical protein